MADLIRAMDVSSHQGPDLSALIAAHQPQHIILKSYLPIEHYPGSMQDPRKAPGMTIDQAQSARDNGVSSLSLYVWGYRDVDPEQTVYEAMNTGTKARVSPPFLALDIEDYEGTAPSGEWIEKALYYADQYGLPVGPILYSSREMWKLCGLTGWNFGRPEWAAGYNGRADLEVPNFSGGQVIAHQYTSKPIDLNVFLPEVLGMPPETEPTPAPDRLAVALNNLGVASHDYADGLEAEARRKGGPRKSMVLGFAAKLRELSPT